VPSPNHPRTAAVGSDKSPDLGDISGDGHRHRYRERYSGHRHPGSGLVSARPEPIS
jgi:hypothetical protein